MFSKLILKGISTRQSFKLFIDNEEPSKGVNLQIYNITVLIYLVTKIFDRKQFS